MNANSPDGTLKLDEIIRVAVLLLLAGHETTVNLISNGVLTLLRFPHLLERLRNEATLAPFLVEELLRYEPPVHIVYRGTLDDVEMEGIRIPKGSSVQLMLGAANRDPRRFEDPDTFRPLLPRQSASEFGGGIHSCFGAPPWRGLRANSPCANWPVASYPLGWFKIPALSVQPDVAGPARTAYCLRQRSELAQLDFSFELVLRKVRPEWDDGKCWKASTRPERNTRARSLILRTSTSGLLA